MINELKNDPHVPIAYKIVQGKYNLLLFGNHMNISDHLFWEEELRYRFPGAFGSANITYLSPEAIIYFDQKIVSLCLIRDRLERSRWKEF